MSPRVVFFGTPDFVVPVVSALHEKGWLAGVVTAPDKKVGRTQILTPTPIKQWAIKHNVPVFAPEQLDQNLHSVLLTLNSSLFIVAAYGHLLPQFILDIPKNGSLNIHPSLLPKYRGPAPIQAAILNGDKISGVSIIKMDKEMDHGPVIITKEIILSDQDTFETLSKNMFEAGAGLLVKVIPNFVSGKAELKEQNHQLATFTHLIKKEDGYFKIDTPPSPEKLDRMIRAYYPWPNAWTKWPFDSFDKTQDKFAQGKNNKIVKFYPDKVVQIEGKKPMRIEEFLKGHPEFPIRL